MLRLRARVLLPFGLLGAAFLAAFLFLGLFGSPRPASADSACTINWDGPSTGGMWATPSNWDLSRVPGSSDVVCIGEASGTDHDMTGTVMFDGSSGTSTTLHRGVAQHSTFVDHRR